MVLFPQIDNFLNLRWEKFLNEFLIYCSVINDSFITFSCLQKYEKQILFMS